LLNVFLNGHRKTFPVSRIRIRKFCAQTVFSSKKMQESGFVPPYKLDEALVATVKHEFVEKRRG